MASAADINIDELQNQISQAENYLQSSLEVRRSMRGSFNFDGNVDMRQSVDRPNSIRTHVEPPLLTTVQPLRPPVPPRDSPLQTPSEPVSEPVSTSNRYAAPSDREALIEKLLSDHKRRKAEREHLASQSDNASMANSMEAPKKARDIPGKEDDQSPATIRFGEESATPSLFRILQADHPVEVGSMLYGDRSLGSVAFQGSPDSLNEASSLQSTIKFTRSLQLSERPINLENDFYHPRPSSSSAPATSSRTTRYSPQEAEMDGEEEMDYEYGLDAQNQSATLFSNDSNDHVHLTEAIEDQPTYAENDRRGRPRYQQQESRIMSLDRTMRPRSRSAQQPFRNAREILTKQAEEEFKRTHTFTPTLYTAKPKRPFSADVEKEEEVSPELNKVQQRKQRIQQLHDMYEKQQRERERLRHEFDKMHMLECTFRPDLRRTASTSPSRRDRSSVSHSSRQRQDTSNESSWSETATRLHDQAAERTRRLHYLTEQIAEEKMAEYTFQPTLNPHQSKFRKVDERPIHQRLEDLQKQRQKHLRDLRESFEQEQSIQFTFQPRIDEKSRVMAQDKLFRDFSTSVVQQKSGELSGVEEAYRVLDRDQDVGVRLLEESRRLQRKKQQLLFERENELALQMQPAVMSKGSRKIAESSDEVKADFDTRMQLHQERVKQSQDEARRQEDERARTWFKPTIDTKTQEIIERSRPDLLEESPKQRANRLSVQDQQTIINHKKALEASIYGSITHTPQIDPISKLFGRRSTLQELHENPRGKQAHTWAKVKAEREMVEECTFQPKINEKSRKLVEPDDYDVLYRKYADDFQSYGYGEATGDANGRRHSVAMSQDSRLQRINLKEPERMVVEMRQRAIEREEKRREALIAREIEELQECTFQPSLVSQYRPEDEDDAPIVVRGLGRHMELRDLAAKLRQENEARVFNAFHVPNVDKLRRPEDGSTIVKTFDLSTGPHHSMSAKSGGNARSKSATRR